MRATASSAFIPDDPKHPLDPESTPTVEAPIEVPIEDSIDLHGFAPRDVLDVVRAYLEAAAEAGFHEVRLIHGRGKGMQRANIRRLLGQLPEVEAFEDAPPGRGGWGATLVWLRPRETPLR